MLVREAEGTEVTLEDRDAERRRRSKPGFPSPRAVTGLLWVVTVAILSSPFIDTQRPINWLDDSWPVGLQMAARQGVQWGTDLVFTYGPYGVLALDRLYFVPEALISLVVAWAVHAALVGLLAARMAAMNVRPSVWAVAGGVLLVRGPMLSLGYETQFVIVLLLAAALDRHTILQRRAVIAAVVAASLGAMLCLWKSSDGLAGLGVIGVASWIAVARGRPILAGTMVAALGLAIAGLWMLAGQSFANLPAYLRGVYEFATGYGPAVSLNNFSLGPVLAIGVVAAFLGLTYQAWRSRDEAFVPLLLVLPPLVLAFRVNLTRDDLEHVLIFGYVVILVMLVAAVTLRTTSRSGRLLRLGLVPLCVLGLLGGPLSQLWVVEQRIASDRELFEFALQPNSSTGGGQLLRQAVLRHYALSEDQIAVLKTGTVDVAPWDLLLPYGYQLQWRPRPALQSYAAYTSYLDHLDATHVAMDGPDHFIFRYEDIDNRYSPFDEPATLQALILNYQVDATSDERYVVLDRRSVALADRRQDDGHVCGDMGRPITVPRMAGRTVFAEVHVSDSTLGRLLTALYAAPALDINFVYSGDHRAGPYRLVPGVMADGMLMSNYVAGNSDLESMFRGDLDKPINSFSVTTQYPFVFERKVCVDFFSFATPG